jgi:hypothetical protein
MIENEQEKQPQGNDLLIGGIIGGIFALLFAGICLIPLSIVGRFDDAGDQYIYATRAAYAILLLGVVAIITGIFGSNEPKFSRKVLISIALIGFVPSFIMVHIVGLGIWVFPASIFLLSASK